MNKGFRNASGTISIALCSILALISLIFIALLSTDNYIFYDIFTSDFDAILNVYLIIHIFLLIICIAGIVLGSLLCANKAPFPIAMTLMILMVILAIFEIVSLSPFGIFFGIHCFPNAGLLLCCILVKGKKRIAPNYNFNNYIPNNNQNTYNSNNNFNNYNPGNNFNNYNRSNNFNGYNHYNPNNNPVNNNPDNSQSNKENQNNANSDWDNLSGNL